MFDDIQKDIKSTPATPTNALDNSDSEGQQPTALNRIFSEEKSDLDPEDIFDEIDNNVNDAEKDYVNQPPNIKLADNLEPNEEEISGLSFNKKSKIKMIIIILTVFLVAIGAAWLAYAYFIKSSINNAVEKNNIEINTASDLPAPENTNNNTNENTAITTVKPIDTDGDGLTDDDESRFGTDPELIDTDGDGLTDQEEVIKYKTNPRGADSDGDGYTDGTEIKNGYNPNGTGQLIDKVELP